MGDPTFFTEGIRQAVDSGVAQALAGGLNLRAMRPLDRERQPGATAATRRGIAQRTGHYDHAIVSQVSVRIADGGSRRLIERLIHNMV